MTACCAALNPGAIFGSVKTGSSDEANYIDKKFEDSLEHYLGPRLEQVLFPLADIMSGTENDEAPVTIEAVSAAIDFAAQLPLTAKLPEVSADPDGEVSFDWTSASGNMFSVSISGSGALSYAGWFGEDSRVHGAEKLGSGVPEEILRGIQKASN
jgi:hypothetical protein